MDRILPRLRQDYERWSRKLVTVRLPEAPDALRISDVLRAHYLLCDHFSREGEAIAIPGPRNEDLLVSTVARQFTSLGGESKWKTALEKAAALFYGLIKNHPFHDGNKRTALLASLYHLTRLSRTAIAAQRDYELLALRTAGNELSQYSAFSEFRRKHSEHDARVRMIARVLERGSRLSDSRFYQITFNELDTILRRFGFKLSNPSGNYIDVVKEEVVRSMAGLGRKKVVERRVVKIGFPGWTKEVTVKAIGSIRREARLTSEYGVDSQVFFKGADPLAALISRYQGLLARLKDK